MAGGQQIPTFLFNNGVGNFLKFLAHCRVNFTSITVGDLNFTAKDVGDGAFGDYIVYIGNGRGIRVRSALDTIYMGAIQGLKHGRWLYFPKYKTFVDNVVNGEEKYYLPFEESYGAMKGLEGMKFGFHSLRDAIYRLDTSGGSNLYSLRTDVRAVLMLNECIRNFVIGVFCNELFRLRIDSFDFGNKFSDSINNWKSRAKEILKGRLVMCGDVVELAILPYTAIAEVEFEQNGEILKQTKNSKESAFARPVRKGECDYCSLVPVYGTAQQMKARSHFECFQCNRMSHSGCLKKKNMNYIQELPGEGEWFCSDDCKQINSALKQVLNQGEQKVPEYLVQLVKNMLTHQSNGHDLDITWRFLHGRKSPFAENPLISMADSVFHEQFDPIQYGLNNQEFESHKRNVKETKFPRMYCALLSVKSTIVSAGVFRVFSKEVAEIPLVATSKGFEGKDYFQCLSLGLERFLKGLGVKNILLPSAEVTRFDFNQIPEEVDELRTPNPLLILSEVLSDPMDQITQCILKTLQKGACAGCGNLPVRTLTFGPRSFVKCFQCKKSFHLGCIVEEMKLLERPTYGKWFCLDCKRISSALNLLVNQGTQKLTHELGDSLDVTWRVLNGRKPPVDEAQILTSMVLSVFYEQFEPMLYDPDFTSHIVDGRNVEETEFSDMFCAVLSVNSTIVSACVFRVFSKEVAGIPLVATSKGSEGKGYFQCLYFGLERFLKGLRVENILLPYAKGTLSACTNRISDFSNEFDQLRTA